MPGAHRRRRPRMAWMDNIKRWTLPVEEYQNDRDKWRKYVHGGPTLGSRTVKEQNSRTVDSNNICLKVNRSARVQRMNNVSGATLATETAV